MPRFYFHLADGTFNADNKGKEFATRVAARAFAIQLAADYERNHAPVPEGLEVCVTDESGKEVFRVSISERRSPRRA